MSVAVEMAPGITATVGVRGGRPCLAGTRIEPWVLWAQWTACDGDVEEVADLYELTPEQVRRAVDFYLLGCSHRWAWGPGEGKKAGKYPVLGQYKGHPCRLVACGRMNSVLIAFGDGYRVVTSRHGLRRLNG